MGKRQNPYGLNSREVLLLLIAVGLSGIITAVMFIYHWDYIDPLVQRLAPTVPIVPPPDGTEEYPRTLPPVVLDQVSDGGAGWLPLGRLEQALGGWQTGDNGVHVLLASRASPATADPGSFWLQPYRLTVAVGGSLVVTCGLYEQLRTDEPPEPGALPWRLGYCYRAGTPAPAALTRVRLLRQPGREVLRLILGSDVDLEIFPSP